MPIRHAYFLMSPFCPCDITPLFPLMFPIVLLVLADDEVDGGDEAVSGEVPIFQRGGTRAVNAPPRTAPIAAPTAIRPIKPNPNNHNITPVMTPFCMRHHVGLRATFDAIYYIFWRRASGTGNRSACLASQLASVWL